MEQGQEVVWAGRERMSKFPPECRPEQGPEMVTVLLPEPAEETRQGTSVVVVVASKGLTIAWFGRGGTQ